MQETNFRQEAVFIMKQYFKVIKMWKWRGFQNNEILREKMVTQLRKFIAESLSVTTKFNVAFHCILRIVKGMITWTELEFSR